MDKNGLILGIIGGIGIGLLFGSEFSNRIVTLIGALLISISIIIMSICHLKNTDKKNR